MKNSRRKFLTDAAKASIAFTIVPRFVLGGKGYRPPSDRINLGFIGTGKQGRSLLHSFADKAQIVGCADVDSRKLALFQSLASKEYAATAGKTEYKGLKGYANFTDMLHRSDIDAVVIATPDHWHALATVLSANAGKHVYCEKPLGHTIEEGRGMVNAMKKNNKILQTGSMQRSWKNFRQACELVRNGYIGSIKEVLVSVGDPAISCELAAETVPANLNWDAWVGPALFKPFNNELSPPVEKDIYPNWRLYKEYGGGMVSDWGAHMFDIAQWGLGMDNSGPVKIIPPQGDAKKGLVLEYANGIKVKHQDFGRNYGVRFIGEKGRIDISRDYLDSDPANIATATIQPNEIHLYNSPDHYSDWLNCIKTNSQPVCSAETGHRTSSVCSLVNIGYWLRQPLEWDPENEKFLNMHAAADLLLKANSRDKWKLG